MECAQGAETSGMVRAVGWDGWDRSANLGQSRVWDPKPGEQQKDWGGGSGISPRVLES